MDGDQGGRATAVFEVAAPPEIVWDCINDIKAYPKMVTGVVAVSIYDGPRTSGGVTMKKAQWTLGFMGYKQTYYNVLTFEPRQNSMTFKLDYTRNSDFDDAVGKWYVEPIGDGSSSRVFYSAALQLRIWLPKFVVNALFESTLGQATSWVAPEAMKRLAAAGGAPGVATAWRRLGRGGERKVQADVARQEVPAAAAAAAAACRPVAAAQGDGPRDAGRRDGVCHRGPQQDDGSVGMRANSSESRVETREQREREREREFCTVKKFIISRATLRPDGSVIDFFGVEFGVCEKRQEEGGPKGSASDAD